MKKLILVLALALVLCASPCFSAELLVRAKGHWLDGADTSKMTEQELASYNARSQKGDIIVVRPDGWEWGSSECPPNFVVVKLKGVAVEDVKKYEEQLIDTTDKDKPIVLKRRKYKIDSVLVDDCAKEAKGLKEISSSTLSSKLTEKNVATAKAELEALKK